MWVWKIEQGLLGNCSFHLHRQFEGGIITYNEASGLSYRCCFVDILCEFAVCFIWVTHFRIFGILWLIPRFGVVDIEEVWELNSDLELQGLFERK